MNFRAAEKPPIYFYLSYEGLGVICLTKFSSLEKRVERLENILIELALHPNRCKYIYAADLKTILLNKRLVKEKKTIVKLSGGRAKVEPGQVRRVKSPAEFGNIKARNKRQRAKFNKDRAKARVETNA